MASILWGGLDPAFINLGLAFNCEEKWDLLKIDLSLQEGLKVEYEDCNAYAHAKQVVEALNEEFFKLRPIIAFEEQPPPGFAEDGEKKRGFARTAGKKPHQHLLISQIIYSMLSERGVECYWVKPKDSREYFGTFSLGSSGSSKKDYESSKARSVAKLIELIGEEKHGALMKTYGGKLDDVADAFLLALYLRENYEEIKKAKEKQRWTVFKSTAKRKPKLKKKLQRSDMLLNNSILGKRLQASHEKVPLLKEKRKENRAAKRLKNKKT